MNKNTTLWIKTPFPGEQRGEGAWHECTTFYERNILWKRHNKLGNKGLPTATGEKPDE